ncbi:hypothetical protein Tco_1456730 [Tanacetum coccineum]
MLLGPRKAYHVRLISPRPCQHGTGLIFGLLCFAIVLLGLGPCDYDDDHGECNSLLKTKEECHYLAAVEIPSNPDLAYALLGKDCPMICERHDGGDTKPNFGSTDVKRDEERNTKSNIEEIGNKRDEIAAFDENQNRKQKRSNESSLGREY